MKTFMIVVCVSVGIIAWTVDADKSCPEEGTVDPAACCHFPFVYKGHSYGACTMNSHNRFWCAFDADYQDGRWANCVCTRNQESRAGCQNGGTCVRARDLECECPPGFSGRQCEHKH